MNHIVLSYPAVNIRIKVLQIRFSGDDDTIYLCQTYEIAHRIIREWFKDSIEDINHLSIGDLEEQLWGNIGYWEITEQVVICE